MPKFPDTRRRLVSAHFLPLLPQPSPAPTAHPILKSSLDRPASSGARSRIASGTPCPLGAAPCGCSAPRARASREVDPAGNRRPRPQKGCGQRRLGTLLGDWSTRQPRSACCEPIPQSFSRSLPRRFPRPNAIFDIGSFLLDPLAICEGLPSHIKLGN